MPKGKDLMAGMIARTLTLALMLLFAGAASYAQEKYPNRPVRIISSTPAGGPQDAMARMIAQYLSEKLGQPFVVENRPGANTMIAAQVASVATPDGYTLLMGTDSTLSINPHMYSQISYKAEDFEPITQMVEWSAHLFINSTVPAQSLREFVDYAKSRPGLLNYGSYGHGSNPHLAAEQIKQVLGIDVVHIPYKGSADSMAAFAANDFQMMMSSVGSARPLAQAQKIRAIAASGTRRAAAFPEVPTFAESGYSAQSFASWFGLVAPKGTPPSIIDLLSRHIRAFVNTDSFKTVVAPRYSWDIVGSSPEEFAAFLKQDSAAYRRQIKENGIAPIN
jgi:tripartite-type tricarboxylate transporter receptor subunit TctC